MELEIKDKENKSGGNAGKNNTETGWDGELSGVGVSSKGNQFFDNRTQREWLSTEEAAYFLSISPNALRIMVHRDQIPAFKMGRRLRFRVQDCRRLFQKKGG